MTRPWPWIFGILVTLGSLVIVCNVLFSIPKADAVVAIPVERVRDPEGVLLGIQDGDCMSEAIVDRRAPDLVAVDVRITMSPWTRGWIGNEGVFYGTLEEAVRALGGTEIAIGPKDIWFKTGPTTARSIWALTTPLGRTVWMAKDAVEREQC